MTNRFGQWGLPNGVNYGYDPANRIELVEQGNATQVFARSHYQYDKVSREVATWRDGPQDDPGSKGERFWFETNNQIKKAYYKADNVWTTTPSNPATFREYTYTPDKLNWSSVNDNGFNAPFVPNPMNQYTIINGSALQYDNRFNLYVFGGTQYTHNAANQLTSVTGNGHSASFTYDGLGRCVRRVVDGVTRVFIYDAWNPIIEFDQTGNWKAMNLYGSGADEILGRYDATLGALIYKQDKQGNITFVLNSSGTTVEKYTYDAYGTPTILSSNNTQLSASAYGNRFMYTGREWIGELGIYDYRHRYYLPSIGRFLETDPMGLQTEGAKLSAGQKALFSPGFQAPEAFGSSETNLFRYCGDDPIDNGDPFGLEFTDRDFEPQGSIPGKFGNTEFKISVGVSIVPAGDGTLSLKVSQYNVRVTTKQFATHANGRPRSDAAVEATKEHENRHVANARALHDANQNRVIKTGLTLSEAQATREKEQTKLADQFSSAGRRDQAECKRAEGVWLPIVERERKK